MSSTFTPVSVTDPTKEKDWAYEIGLMDWDDTKIVFTKRSLLEFLRYTGTTVDTNLSNIAKLPRYCQFGKLSGTESIASKTASEEFEPTTTVGDTTFKPTRRVRDAPEGKQTLNLFEGEFEDDALSTAPLSSQVGVGLPGAAPNEAAEATNSNIPESTSPDSEENVNELGFRPSRRVRTNPGGHSSLQRGLFGDDTPVEKFKPTRRVREGPGGQDSLADML